MIDLNKPFTTYATKPKSRFRLISTYQGLSCYEDVDISNTLYFDILSLRGATIQVNRGTITINGNQTTISTRFTQFGYIVPVGENFNKQDLNPGDTIKTISNERNISLPILAIRGEGGTQVQSIAGPYFVDGGHYYPADVQGVYRYKEYLLVPSVTSVTQTARDLSISDLEIAPEQPKNDLLPNLFADIKSGTHTDTYVKDKDHKISIRLTHTSSHG